MKGDFQFANLLGTVYSRGNVLFTPDGNALLTPVGNRVTCFDLVNSTTFTFPFETRKNIVRIGLNPRATLLLSVDDEGRAILVNFRKRTVLHHFNFKGRVRDIKFSPCGNYFACAVDNQVQVWRSPRELEHRRDFAPFVRHRVYTGHFDLVDRIEWSDDSRFFLSSSRDLTVRIFSLDPEEGFIPTSLQAHRERIVGAFFSADQETIYTVSRDGALFRWSYEPLYRRAEIESGETDADAEAARKHRWIVKEKHYFGQTPAKLKCCAYHPDRNLMVAGFSSGLFTIHELGDDSFNLIHTLSMSQNAIDHVSINRSGDWLAFGASDLGQLLVWEWQSETYILKQQGHFDALDCMAWSTDGRRCCTGSEDGKIKVWDLDSGFCLVTLEAHTSAVTGLAFSGRGNVLFSSSLDGSVRAWDMSRYRNFRTFVAGERLQFSCVAADPSGELVCAGSTGSYDVQVWSVQTGQLVDSLSGHEAPVCALGFSADGSLLASGSWDKSVRVWNIFARKVVAEPLTLSSEVQALAFRPDGRECCIATLDGQLSFWDCGDSRQTSVIDGRRDIRGGRRFDDRATSENRQATRFFNSISYLASGDCVLATGNSRFVCLYDTSSGTMLKKWQVSHNQSLTGVTDKLNSGDLTEAGPKQALPNLSDDDGEGDDLAIGMNGRRQDHLPGASRGDLSLRKARPEIRTRCVQVSPTGRHFATATTEGLVIYALDDPQSKGRFDPMDLDVEATPTNARAYLTGAGALLDDGLVVTSIDLPRALLIALRLNETPLIRDVWEAVPPSDIKALVTSVPTIHLDVLLRHGAAALDRSPHLEFSLLWATALLERLADEKLRATRSLTSGSGGRLAYGRSSDARARLRHLARALNQIQASLASLATDNHYNITYLLSSTTRSTAAARSNQLAKARAPTIEKVTTASWDNPPPGGWTMDNLPPGVNLSAMILPSDDDGESDEVMEDDDEGDEFSGFD
ncbi:U3 snoRNP protein [Savitreella phatthalungensis]